MSWARGAALGAVCMVCAVAIACGAALSPGKASAPPAQEAAPVAGAPAAPHADVHAEAHAEIDALDREIAAALARARIAPPDTAACSGDGCATAMAEPFATPSTADAACRPAPGDRCRDVCSLAASICRSQERICELARQLTGDDWAANQCTRARASCQTAHERCCGCVL